MTPQEEAEQFILGELVDGSLDRDELHIRILEKHGVGAARITPH